MWYYESLANQWPAPPWATDSHRFATCTVITVQFLHCTIINRNPYSERFPYRTCFSRFDLALPFLRTAANQWPKEAQATDWPTIRSTTLLTADPKSVAQKSAFSRPAHCEMMVALRLRSLRFHSPRLCRIAVFLIKTNVSLSLPLWASLFAFYRS